MASSPILLIAVNWLQLPGIVKLVKPNQTTIQLILTATSDLVAKEFLYSHIEAVTSILDSISFTETN